MNLINLAEKGWIPDHLIRAGIRRLCAERLKEEFSLIEKTAGTSYQQRLDQLRESPIALATDAANQQHYEVPAAFYQRVLGRHLKYSSSLWTNDTTCLDEAEENMLKCYVQRARIADGQTILELGCGWGSLTLWVARRFPNARITAVSNSHSQRQYIEDQARTLGLENVTVLTCDINRLSLDQRFDRVISIEMFEHMSNYQQLFYKISQWLAAEGELFVHIFCHRQLLYPFNTEGTKNWMGKYFFTGGQMPSADTFSYFQDDLALQQQWFINGSHYQKSAQAWLDNLDGHRAEIHKIFSQSYGPDQADLWVQRWRMFFMACAELFGYGQGFEWQIGHYRFTKP